MTGLPSRGFLFQGFFGGFSEFLGFFRLEPVEVNGTFLPLLTLIDEEQDVEGEDDEALLGGEQRSILDSCHCGTGLEQSG